MIARLPSRSKMAMQPSFPPEPERSELWRRVLSTEAEEVMPPPSSGKRLTDIQKDLIQRWIKQGANYAPHWAFSRIEKPTPPPMEDQKIANSIDAFILEAEGKSSFTLP